MEIQTDQSQVGQESEIKNTRRLDVFAQEEVKLWRNLQFVIFGKPHKRSSPSVVGVYIDIS